MVNRDAREFKISADATKFIKSLPDDKILFKSDKQMLFTFKAGYRKDIYK